MPKVITQMVTGSSLVIGPFDGELLVPGDTLGSLVLENAKHSDPTLL